MATLPKVAVAVSGGVDSAVAALLLKKRGFNVMGVFMKNWDSADEGLCSNIQDRKDAEFVCKTLGVPFHEVNFVKEYWCHVFTYLLKDYECGFTPNPDVLCNRHIKFNAFMHYCLNVLNTDVIATGHYALTSAGAFHESKNYSKIIRLLKPRDSFKDQTLFLSRITQESLQKTMFPLGNILKSEVKEIARKNGLLPLSKKKESTGICFIGKRKFADFIAEYIPVNYGEMRDLDCGKLVCLHSGLHMWTVGQCCHLKHYSKKYFVAYKKVESNTIYVAAGTDHPSLFSRILYADSPHWIASFPFNSSLVLECEFRFQHTKPLIRCKVNAGSFGIVVLLQKAVRALTPGQFAVFYRDGECLGSARILHQGPSLLCLGESVPLNYREYEHS